MNGMEWSVMESIPSNTTHSFNFPFHPIWGVSNGMEHTNNKRTNLSLVFLITSFSPPLQLFTVHEIFCYDNSSLQQVTQISLFMFVLFNPYFFCIFNPYPMCQTVLVHYQPASFMFLKNKNIVALFNTYY